MKGKKTWRGSVASLDSYGQGMATYLKCCSKVIPMVLAQPSLASNKNLDGGPGNKVVGGHCDRRRLEMLKEAQEVSEL